MANLRDIKTRIGSVKSTQKITNAMKLVSAAKFSRASHAVQSARPYADSFDQMVVNLIASGESELKSPLLRKNSGDKVLLVVLATDRGLCGGLNSNLFKKCNEFLENNSDKQVDIVAWGRRACQYANKLENKVVQEREKILEGASYSVARELASELMDRFLAKEYGKILIAYPTFESALSQVPTIDQLLPVSLDSTEKTPTTENYLVEPVLSKLIDSILERKVVGTIYQALLEGAASEHGARMTAMDSATNNAREVIKNLTLQYNRARQAAITTELTEIISGAEALN